MNGFRLKTLHTLVLGSIFVALFQSEKSYVFSLKSPEMVNPGIIINSSTMPMVQAKGRGEARFNHAKWTNLMNGFRSKTLHTLVLVFIFVALFESKNSISFL